MNARKITIPAGTRRFIEFTTTYSATWSEVAKRGDNIEAAEVTDAKFVLKKRRSNADSDALIEKTLSDGISITSGKVTVTVFPDDTKDMNGEYAGTLRLYLVDGGVVDWEDAAYPDTPYFTVTVEQGAVEDTTP